MRGPYPKGRERRSDSTDALANKTTSGEAEYQKGIWSRRCSQKPAWRNRSDGAVEQRYDVHVQWLENMTAMPVHIHTRL